MFHELKNEVKLSFILHTKSPLSIRTKSNNIMNPSLSDMQCIRSRYKGVDTVIIPGSSLKGVIRSRYESIVSLFDENIKCCNITGQGEESCNHGKEMKNASAVEIYNNMCPACKLFGSTAIASRIFFSDAYPIEEPVIGERTGVRINRITGAAQAGALFDFEIVEEGNFLVAIHIKNYELYQFILLLYVLKDIDDGYVTIGSASTRGNGRVEIKNLNISFREYRKNVKGLIQIDGKEINLKDLYHIDYCWNNLFYGECNFETVDLNNLLKELQNLDCASEISRGLNKCQNCKHF